MFVCPQRLPTVWGIQIEDKEKKLLSQIFLPEKAKQIICKKKKDLPIFCFSNGRKEKKFNQ